MPLGVNCRSGFVRPAEQVCRTPDNRQSSLQRPGRQPFANWGREHMQKVGGEKLDLRDYLVGAGEERRWDGEAEPSLS